VVERLLVLLLLSAAALAAWRLVQWRAARSRDAAGLGLIGYRAGLPAILYFTAPDCAPCETVQQPALARLAERFPGRLQILEVDAAAQPALADAWGVLAVPTTFLIDGAGRPRRVNHGPTREKTLMAQLAQIGLAVSAVSPSRQDSGTLRGPNGVYRGGEAASGLESEEAPAPEVESRGRAGAPDEGKRHGTIARSG
jgi:thiol-disulfide isomerase/thioredoxin